MEFLITITDNIPPIREEAKNFIKEPSFLIIDDRCINFSGNYSETLDKIENFRVWYK